jgi:hypothetical protein
MEGKKDFEPQDERQANLRTRRSKDVHDEGS